MDTNQTPAASSEQPAGPQSEGRLAKAIERQTAKLPSDVFLWSAVGAIGASGALQLAGYQKLSNFIGHWVPTILILGLYNKLVKIAGSENASLHEPLSPTIH